MYSDVLTCELAPSNKMPLGWFAMRFLANCVDELFFEQEAASPDCENNRINKLEYDEIIEWLNEEIIVW